MKLQRATIPRFVHGEPQKPSEQRTSLLREGLDQPQPQLYYIHEEGVPRAGIRLHLTFQQTRWYDGSVVIWLGVRKGTGRNEGSSGLAFDRLVETGGVK